jgi:hypothetical protein
MRSYTTQDVFQEPGVPELPRPTDFRQRTPAGSFFFGLLPRRRSADLRAVDSALQRFNQEWRKYEALAEQHFFKEEALDLREHGSIRRFSRHWDQLGSRARKLDVALQGVVSTLETVALDKPANWPGHAAVNGLRQNVASTLPKMATALGGLALGERVLTDLYRGGVGNGIARATGAKTFLAEVTRESGPAVENPDALRDMQIPTPIEQKVAPGESRAPQRRETNVSLSTASSVTAVELESVARARARSPQRREGHPLAPNPEKSPERSPRRGRSLP